MASWFHNIISSSYNELPFSSGVPSSGILFSLLAVLLVSMVILHLIFKPKLHLPPGPLALPIVGNWLQVGQDLSHEAFAALAKKYGEIVFLKMGRRNMVVVSSPELAKEVLHSQGVEFSSRTHNDVLDVFTGKGQDITHSLYGDHWRKMRRILNVSFFNNKVVQQSGAQWQEEINSAIADLKANPDAATSGVVVHHRLQLAMYNNIYRVMFNRRFERVDDPLFVELKRLNDERARLASSFQYNFADFIPILRPFLRAYLQLCQSVKDQRMRLFNKHFLEERKKLTSLKPPANGDKCAIDHILEAQRNGEITEDDVPYIVENINVAGIETTFSAIEWGLAELINNPDIQEKVRKELNTVVGYGVPLTEPDVPKLPYLHAVVKETMRLHTAVPLLVPHMNVHQAKLGGYDIPAGSKVFVNAWLLANSKELWEKPEVFNPERFLGSSAEKIEYIAGTNDFRFVPFGVGRRGCPGVILALPIVSIMLGRMVQAFELLPPPGQSKVDVTGSEGQFGLRIASYPVVVLKPM